MRRAPLRRSAKRLATRKGLARGKGLRRVGRRAEREALEWEFARSATLLAARGRCARCTRRRVLHVHHVRPRSRGGKHALENLVALCFACHGAVHDHTADDWTAWLR